MREAFRQRAAGTPMGRIAEALDMTPSGAQQLLRNRGYLVQLHVGSYVDEVAHEPLVTP